MQTSLLSIGPTIRREGERLVAETSLVGRILTLGLAHTRVVVDPQASCFRIERHRAWAGRQTRTVPFEAVRRIKYSYRDLADTWFSSGRVHDAFDCYTVSLVLWEGREEIVLFRFLGDGATTNRSGLPDWFYRKELRNDWSGTQERDSRLFATLLEELSGVSLVQ